VQLHIDNCTEADPAYGEGVRKACEAIGAIQPTTVTGDRGGTPRGFTLYDGQASIVSPSRRLGADSRTGTANCNCHSWLICRTKPPVSMSVMWRYHQSLRPDEATR
jgi:hypothetical protein